MPLPSEINTELSEIVLARVRHEPKTLNDRETQAFLAAALLVADNIQRLVNTLRDGFDTLAQLAETDPRRRP